MNWVSLWWWTLIKDDESDVYPFTLTTKRGICLRETQYTLLVLMYVCVLKFCHNLYYDNVSKHCYLWTCIVLYLCMKFLGDFSVMMKIDDESDLFIHSPWWQNEAFVWEKPSLLFSVSLFVFGFCLVLFCILSSVSFMFHIRLSQNHFKVHIFNVQNYPIF